MNLCVNLYRGARCDGTPGKLDFDFIMTFAVMDSDFGACEQRDSRVVHEVGARAHVFFPNLSKFEIVYFKV